MKTLDIDDPQIIEEMMEDVLSLIASMDSLESQSRRARHRHAFNARFEAKIQRLRQELKDTIVLWGKDLPETQRASKEFKEAMGYTM